MLHKRDAVFHNTDTLGAYTGRTVVLCFLVAAINIAGAKDKGAEKAPEDGAKKPSRKREVWTEQVRFEFNSIHVCAVATNC